MTAKKTSPKSGTPAPTSNPTPTPSKKTTPPVEETRRMDRQEIIYNLITQAGGKITLEKLESEGQKIKRAKPGNYSATAKSAFVVKDGSVLPEPSEKGLRGQLQYCQKRKLVTWLIRKFPKQASEVAKKESLPMPNLEASPSSVFQRPLVVTNNRGITSVSGRQRNGSDNCPICQIERLRVQMS